MLLQRQPLHKCTVSFSTEALLQSNRMWRGFFDSLSHDITSQVLQHLRAPPELVRLFNFSCAHGQRLFFP